MHQNKDTNKNYEMTICCKMRLFLKIFNYCGKVQYNFPHTIFTTLFMLLKFIHWGVKKTRFSTLIWFLSLNSHACLKTIFIITFRSNSREALLINGPWKLVTKNDFPSIYFSEDTSRPVVHTLEHKLRQYLKLSRMSQRSQKLSQPN